MNEIAQEGGVFIHLPNLIVSGRQDPRNPDTTKRQAAPQTRLCFISP